MDLKEIGVNVNKCVYSAQYRDYWRALVNAAFNLWFPEAMESVTLKENVQ